MTDYVDASLDPEAFVAALAGDYEDAGADASAYENEDDVEEAMAGLAAGPAPGSTDWKQLIADLAPAPQLSLGPRYVREAQDPKHRMGDLLEGCFHVYQQKNPGDPTGANFYTWLDAMPDWDRVVMVANAESAGKTSAAMMRGTQKGNIKPSMVKAFMKGVAYLDKTGRKSHRVLFKGGTAFSRNGEHETELSTANMATVFSGKGYGIWVISENGKLYVGNHVKGMVHHSSFLSGAEVMCGGEMWARNGKIQFLSAKSGHYHPGRENLVWALNVLETCVSNYNDIKVMAWNGADPKVYLVSPLTFASSARWVCWGNMNKTEMTRLKVGDFSSFPAF